MPRPGRPLKLTAARQKQIVEAARLGAHREQAAMASGVSRSTLQSWLARGEAEDATAPFRDFARVLREAETEAELESLRSIARAAADGDWRARTWLLERRWPDRWGRRTRHELTGADGEPVDFRNQDGWNLAALSDKDLGELERLARKAASA